jgi:hypothetical protein
MRAKKFLMNFMRDCRRVELSFKRFKQVLVQLQWHTVPPNCNQTQILHTNAPPALSCPFKCNLSKSHRLSTPSQAHNRPCPEDSWATNWSTTRWHSSSIRRSLLSSRDLYSYHRRWIQAATFSNQLPHCKQIQFSLNRPPMSAHILKTNLRLLKYWVTPFLL